jgi:hypothetical protein
LQIDVAGPIAKVDCPPVDDFHKRVSVLEAGWKAALESPPFDAVIHMGGHFVKSEAEASSSAAFDMLGASLGHLRDGGWFVYLSPGHALGDFGAAKALARQLITGDMPSDLSSVVSITLYSDSVFVRKLPAEFASAVGPPIRSDDPWVQAVSNNGGEWLDCKKAKWAPPHEAQHGLHDFVKGGCAAVGRHFASMTFVGDSIMRGFYVGFVAAMSGDCLGYGAQCQSLALSGLEWADPQWSQGSARFLSAEHLEAIKRSGGPPNSCKGVKQLAHSCHNYLRPSVSLCGGTLNVSFVWLGQDTPCEGTGKQKGAATCSDLPAEQVSQLTHGSFRNCEDAIAQGSCENSNVKAVCKRSCQLCDKGNVDKVLSAKAAN